MISADEALERLKAGNARFAANRSDLDKNAFKPGDHILGQTPFAIVLGCSDSRVPAEIVFDQGLGDLFVIRVAGNVVAPSQIGSVEFAAEQFHTRLVVVLGHSNCGAVMATVQELKQSLNSRSPHLRSIVNRIIPAVQPLLEAREDHDPDEFLDLAVRANIRISAAQLRHGSQIIEDLIMRKALKVVGAEYALDTGRVTFLPDALTDS
jgi:carbonic anhydrase